MNNYYTLRDPSFGVDLYHLMKITSNLSYFDLFHLYGKDTTKKLLSVKIPISKSFIIESNDLPEDYFLYQNLFSPNTSSEGKNFSRFKEQFINSFNSCKFKIGESISFPPLMDLLDVENFSSMYVKIVSGEKMTVIIYRKHGDKKPGCSLYSLPYSQFKTH
jgi:hypothetical protein